MKLTFILCAYLMWLGWCVLSSAAHALALRLTRVRVLACRLFIGRRMAGVTLGGIDFELGWVPLGTSVRYDVPTFWLRPLWVRIGVMLVGPLVLLLCTAIILGPQATWRHFVTGFVQLPLGALHPLSTAQDLIARLHGPVHPTPFFPGHLSTAQDLIARLHGTYLHSVPVVAAVLAVKLAALECLPIGGLTTAQALLELVGHGVVVRSRQFQQADQPALCLARFSRHQHTKAAPQTSRRTNGCLVTAGSSKEMVHPPAIRPRVLLVVDPPAACLLEQSVTHFVFEAGALLRLDHCPAGRLQPSFQNLFMLWVVLRWLGERAVPALWSRFVRAPARERLALGDPHPIPERFGPPRLRRMEISRSLQFPKRACRR